MTGRQLKDFRETLGYTAVKFAKLLGCNLNYLYKIEKPDYKAAPVLPIHVALFSSWCVTHKPPYDKQQFGL